MADYSLLYQGAFTMAKVMLSHHEMIKAESDAMVSMSSTINVEGKLEGGVLGGIGRLLSGEKFFFQTLKAERGAGEVLLSPSSLGDVSIMKLDGEVGYLLQKDAFLASDNNIEITTAMQDVFKGLFSGEGFFVLRASGKGTLLVSAFGAIHEINIPSGEEVIVDNSHLVAWPENIAMNLEKASSSGWVSSIMSGEGIVCRFRGPGKIYIQTRNPKAFSYWMRKVFNKKN